MFGLIGIIPESGREVSKIGQFKIDYTFWMNLVFVFLAGWLIWMNKKFLQNHKEEMMEMEGNVPLKRTVVWIFIVINTIGAAAFIYTQFNG